MCSTPEVNKIDSKRMHIDAMTDKGEGNCGKECNILLDLRENIVTKEDKKHAKREDKARLNHKYYWVHQKGAILFNGMKAVYNILNNQDKVTMKHFYEKRCKPDLEKGFGDM